MDNLINYLRKDLPNKKNLINENKVYTSSQVTKALSKLKINESDLFYFLIDTILLGKHSNSRGGVRHNIYLHYFNLEKLKEQLKELTTRISNLIFIYLEDVEENNMNNFEFEVGKAYKAIDKQTGDLYFSNLTYVGALIWNQKLCLQFQDSVMGNLKAYSSKEVESLYFFPN